MTCPCGGLPAGADFENCCGPALDLTVWPATAEVLMRSRYTAFVKGDADHLFRTWHAKTRPTSIDVDPATAWFGLEIVDTDKGGENDNEGTVHFRARYREADGMGVIDETSRFLRRGGRWVYVDGIIF